MENGPVPNAPGLLHRCAAFALGHAHYSNVLHPLIAQTTLTHLSWSCLAGLVAAITLKSARQVFDGTRFGRTLQMFVL